MTSPTDDDGLVQELAAALRQQDDVPPHRRDAARAAFTWRTVDAELLALTHDSLEVADAPVRGAALDVRTVGYHGDGFSLEIEVDDDHVVGQVLATGDDPVDAVEIDAALHRTTDRLVLDASGVFSLRAPTGPVCFTIRAGRKARRTPWLVLVTPQL